ncbi:serine/threonine-protein kinase [Nonomuraea sp. NPDC049309]|uniref:serine/threonine-protein kinase n=1 Tax=Nonomuraea sp. NPDC049309 TaxID=3364350 RepID=UPI00371FE438
MSDEKLKPLEASDPREVGGYRLLARLGTGGMGRVYLGRSKGGRPVAVKVIHPYLAEDTQFRRRFEAEVAAVRRVGGIHTVQVVDASPDADPPWLVTEYVAGPSLREAVSEHGAFSTAAAVAGLGAGLAEGLMAIHARGIIHRDLKPGNVLLGQDGPRIIDFGIARALDATSQTTRSVVGTPGFMAPEQLQGRDAGPAGDVFCLAAVLAFAATGRGPFGQGPVEVLGYRIVNEQPDLTGVPEPLLPLIAAGLAKNPDDRPGLEVFLERCSALAEDGKAALPEPVTTMIGERVAESELLASPAQDVPGNRRRLAPPARMAVVVATIVLAVLASVAAVAIGNGLGTAVTSKTATDASPRTPAPEAPLSFEVDDATYSPTPTPEPDPTRKAFEMISAGDCLDAFERPPLTWSRSMPRAVRCSRSDAYMKVVRVVDDHLVKCAVNYLAPDGRTWWSYRSNTGDEISLCVQRQFRPGQCLPAKKDKKRNLFTITNSDLLMVIPCTGSAPKGRNVVLRITAFTKGSCPRGGRRIEWHVRDRTLCTRIV